jgi:hypothetical protein
MLVYFAIVAESDERPFEMLFEEQPILCVEQYVLEQELSQHPFEQFEQFADQTVETVANGKLFLRHQPQ